MPTLDEMTTYLRNWAADNKGYFEPEGEIGFGRECVGIVCGNNYPAYAWETDEPDPRFPDNVNLRKWERTEEAAPPSRVVDAYHKSECLAVLGRGRSAIWQLYIWVRALEENGVGVVVETRRHASNVFELALHGPTESRLRILAGG